MAIKRQPKKLSLSVCDGIRVWEQSRVVLIKCFSSFIITVKSLKVIWSICIRRRNVENTNSVKWKCVRSSPEVYNASSKMGLLICVVALRLASRKCHKVTIISHVVAELLKARNAYFEIFRLRSKYVTVLVLIHVLDLSSENLYRPI